MRAFVDSLSRRLALHRQDDLGGALAGDLAELVCSREFEGDGAALALSGDLAGVADRVAVDHRFSHLAVELLEEALVPHPVRDVGGAPGEAHHPVVEGPGHPPARGEGEVFVLLRIFDGQPDLGGDDGVVGRLDDVEVAEAAGLRDIEFHDRAGQDDVAVVAVTDLAITTKAHPSGILAWVTSLSEGKPVTGVEVSVLSTKNQILAAGKTDERGLVELDAPADHPAGEPWIVLAAKGDDLSFRRLDQRKWDLPTVNKDGREPPKGLDGFLYAARGHFIFRGLGGYLDTYFACLPEPGSLCLFSYRERYGG
ncbi:MAG TPA: hypothetical protein EYQ68_06190 [Cytophagales bacterium]|nr:hypothetical protein [Cytophagales bacterium]